MICEAFTNTYRRTPPDPTNTRTYSTLRLLNLSRVGPPDHQSYRGKDPYHRCFVKGTEEVSSLTRKGLTILLDVNGSAETHARKSGGEERRFYVTQFWTSHVFRPRRGCKAGRIGVPRHQLLEPLIHKVQTLLLPLPELTYGHGEVQDLVRRKT